MLQDSNELARELYKGEWRFLISGKWLFGDDLPKECDYEHIRSRFEDLFNRYFVLRLVDKGGLERLRGICIATTNGGRQNPDTAAW